MMQYWKVIWHHDFSDEPVVMYSEIGEDGYETRKIEEFRDGRTSWADENNRRGDSVLSEIPVGPIEEVQSQAEFSAWVIQKEDFEKIWTKLV